MTATRRSDPARRDRIRLRLAALAVASLVARALFADRFGLTRWNLFLPPLVLVPVALAVVASAPLGRRSRLVAVALTVALGAHALHVDQPLLLAGRAAHAAPPPAHGPDRSLRVLVFNVEALKRGADRVRAVIEEAGADLVFLTQSPRDAARAREGLAPLLEGKHVVSVPGNRHLAFSARPMRLVHAENRSRNARLTRIAVEADDGGELDVLLVHLRFPISRTDRLAFGDLRRAMDELGERALVVGDFNAPRGSRWLRESVEGWRDASMASHGRLLASWPSPLPLWQIDHVFARGLEPTAFEIRPGPASDHAALVADLVLPPPS